ncbi:YbdD/YjiX family protein [Alkanindiges illinoisensis]|uniref:YbdD/YjiX family protein n=1 Tax=Alkanindiges illinoisensis TaxID=197183 RepID=UPI000A014685|nr:YbdD/YjiX family protein [Alkanindiges illinoisensis]
MLKRKVNSLHIHRILPAKTGSVAVQVGLSWQSKLKLIITRLAQSFRLMVGVHDYQAYLQHMQQHHPQLQAMTEKQFYRHCLEARYPNKAGKVGKCPC